MEAIVSVLERAGRYLSLIRPMDVLDVAIIAYLVYKILCLVRSTRAENILKGVAIFLVALWLSSPAALNLRGVNYILSHMVEWGVLALIILFQPEIRQLLEKVGSRNIRLLRIFQPEQQSSELERAIDQTVVACTDMASARANATRCCCPPESCAGYLAPEPVRPTVSSRLCTFCETRCLGCFWLTRP